MKTFNLKAKTFGLLALCLSVFTATNANAVSYDFTYGYSNPSLLSSQTYIVQKSNVSLYFENPVWLWKTTVGGATKGASPGFLIYHFSFGSNIIDEAHLRMNMPTFHWSYSKGHNLFEASTNGTDWQTLMDVPPPAFGSANSGFFNQNLPTWFMGSSDIWLKINLDSYGRSAHLGGALTNTAQHSRWDNRQPNAETFKLQVAYKQNQEIPEPASMLLLGAGMIGAGLKRRRAN